MCGAIGRVQRASRANIARELADTANQGQIALQAEGSEVEFRKIVLTPITNLKVEGQ